MLMVMNCGPLMLSSSDYRAVPPSPPLLPQQTYNYNTTIRQALYQDVVAAGNDWVDSMKGQPPDRGIG